MATCAELDQQIAAQWSLYALKMSSYALNQSAANLDYQSAQAAMMQIMLLQSQKQSQGCP